MKIKRNSDGFVSDDVEKSLSKITGVESAYLNDRDNKGWASFIVYPDVAESQDVMIRKNGPMIRKTVAFKVEPRKIASQIERELKAGGAVGIEVDLPLKKKVYVSSDEKRYYDGPTSYYDQPRIFVEFSKLELGESDDAPAMSILTEGQYANTRHMAVAAKNGAFSLEQAMRRFSEGELESGFDGVNDALEAIRQIYKEAAKNFPSADAVANILLKATKFGDKAQDTMPMSNEDAPTMTALIERMEVLK